MKCHSQDQRRERVLRATLERCNRLANQGVQLWRRHHEQAAFTDMQVQLRGPADVPIREYNGGDVSVLDVRVWTAMPLPVKALGQLRVGTQPARGSCKGSPRVRFDQHDDRRAAGRNPVRVSGWHTVNDVHRRTVDEGHDGKVHHARCKEFLAGRTGPLLVGW